LRGVSGAFAAVRAIYRILTAIPVVRNCDLLYRFQF
jgi:hypothetical protein